MHQSNGHEPHVLWKGEKLLSFLVRVGMSRFFEVTSATFHGLFRCFTLDARGLVRPASGADAGGGTWPLKQLLLPCWWGEKITLTDTLRVRWAAGN
jgi:hypothetical protein